MKTKILMLLSLIMLTSALTGCDIKFIEKAPPKESTETSEDLGDIVDNPEDTDHMTLSSESSETSEQESSEEKPSSTETSTEPSTPSESTETTTLKENQQEANGVIFNMQTKEMYVKADSKLYANAKLSGTASSGVSQGSKLTVYGISEDGKIAMVRIASGTIYYTALANLSNEVVPYPTEESSTETEEPTSSEVPSSQTSQSSQQPSEQPSSQEPSSSQSTEQQSSEKPSSSETKPNPKPPEQPKPTGGIPYPSNPASTSINFGITFADETFTATVVNKTTMNSGPGKVLNSTGYIAIETFTKGTTVNCTGIGQNGYVRVVLADGTVGFILGTDLKRN